jgi:hypothetical protein
MQSRTDSFMEAVTNTAIGLVISTIANYFVIPAVLGVHMTHAQNVALASIFTVISIARSYTLRRVFNGRTPWQALRAAYSGSPMNKLFQRIKLRVLDAVTVFIERRLENLAVALAYLARRQRIANDRFMAKERALIGDLNRLRDKLEKASAARDAVDALINKSGS